MSLRCLLEDQRRAMVHFQLQTLIPIRCGMLLVSGTIDQLAGSFDSSGDSGLVSPPRLARLRDEDAIEAC